MHAFIQPSPTPITHIHHTHEQNEQHPPNLPKTQPQLADGVEAAVAGGPGSVAADTYDALVRRGNAAAEALASRGGDGARREVATLTEVRAVYGMAAAESRGNYTEALQRAQELSFLPHERFRLQVGGGVCVLKREDRYGGVCYHNLSICIHSLCFVCVNHTHCVPYTTTDVCAGSRIVAPCPGQAAAVYIVSGGQGPQCSASISAAATPGGVCGGTATAYQPGGVAADCAVGSNSKQFMMNIRDEEKIIWWWDTCFRPLLVD